MTALVVGVLGCRSAETTPGASVLAKGAETTIFASQTSLGAHVMRATVTRTPTSGGGATSTETLELHWKDADHWSLVRTRDDRAVEDLRVFGGRAWSSHDGDWRDEGDAEPFRVMLSRTWDPWALAFEPVEERLVATEVGAEVYAGRPARKHEVSYGPPPPPRRKRQKPRPGPWDPASASGTVWIDEGTAVRLGADVTVSATINGAPTDVALRFALDHVNGDVAVEPPTGVDRR